MPETGIVRRRGSGEISAQLEPVFHGTVVRVATLVISQKP